MKSGPSIDDPKAGFIQDLFLSHLVRFKQVQSYQVFYIFCIIQQVLFVNSFPLKIVQLLVPDVLIQPVD